MKSFVTLFIVLIISIGLKVHAQPVSTIGNITTNGVKAAVPVYVSNFTNVQTFQVYILYNPAIATPAAGSGLITSGVLSGVSGNLGWSTPAPGVIKVTWYSLDLPVCKTISGNPILFYVNFVKAANGTTALTFDDSDDTYCKFTCDATTYPDDPASTYLVSGSLTFTNDAPVTRISSISACPSMSISIPVIVTGFNNIGTFNLTINYPSTDLTFANVTNTSSFPGLSYNNPSPGVITMGGTASGTDGFTLTDGSTLIMLNFTYIGGTPTLSLNDDIEENCEYTGPSNYGYPVLADGLSNYINGEVTQTSTKIWTGSTSTAWETSGNWCGGVPTSSVDALIPTTPTGNQMPVISNVTTADCYNLIMESGSTLYISSTSAIKNGSLIVHGNFSGTGQVTYDRRFKTSDSDDNIYDWYYFSSPVGNVTATSSGFISNIFPWNEVSGEWSTTGLGSTFKGFESGKGYNLKQTETSTGAISFTGSVVTSASVVATSPYTINYGEGYPAEPGSLLDYNARKNRTPFGGGGWNLLGNPFTSAMTISSFLDANDGDGVTVSTNKFDPNYVAVYIYDGSVAPNGQYLYRGKTTAFADPVTDESPANTLFGYDYVQVGQGFFVLAQKNGVSFTFDKSMQAHQTTVPLKSAKTDDSWPGLKLKVKYPSGQGSTVVMYNENMTTGLDPGYDIGQLSTYPDVEIYTALVSKANSVNFAQQALPVGDASKSVVPVGVDAEKGGLVTFSASVRPIGNGTFYLEDKVTGTITDLSKDTYTVNLPEKTAGTGRFFIHTSMATGIQPILNQDDLSVRIWTANHRVNIEGAVSAKATGAIYDLLGRKILESRLSDAHFNTLSVPADVRGIYLVKVNDGEKTRTQKVVF